MPPSQFAARRGRRSALNVVLATGVAGGTFYLAHQILITGDSASARPEDRPAAVTSRPDPTEAAAGLERDTVLAIGEAVTGPTPSPTSPIEPTKLPAVRLPALPLAGPPPERDERPAAPAQQPAAPAEKPAAPAERPAAKSSPKASPATAHGAARSAQVVHPAVAAHARPVEHATQAERAAPAEDTAKAPDATGGDARCSCAPQAGAQTPTPDDWPELSRQAPSAESELRASPGDQTAVRFVNRSAAKVQVYWLDYEGRRVLYATLSPGETITITTYLTHPWVVTDAKDGALFVVLPTPERGQVTVR